jgi:hypothetical protein
MLNNYVEKLIVILRGDGEFESKGILHSKWRLKEGPPGVGAN